MAESEKPTRPSRRAFLGALATGPLVAGALPAQEPASPDAGAEAVAAALTEAVRQRYGGDLDAEELEAVRKQIRQGLEAAERLRAASRLANADEPVTRFEARPASSGEPR
jgi:hypothetical protein